MTMTPPAGYLPWIHDALDPADVAAELADKFGVTDEAEVDQFIFETTRRIYQARGF